eukprot:2275017-Amphidinium_carterae.1
MSSGKLRPQHIANALWALASFEYKSEVTTALFESARLRAHEFQTQELSLVMWSLAKLHVVDKPLLQA